MTCFLFARLLFNLQWFSMFFGDIVLIVNTCVVCKLIILYVLLITLFVGDVFMYVVIAT